jgi:hypothetical protein
MQAGDGLDLLFSVADTPGSGMLPSWDHGDDPPYGLRRSPYRSHCMTTKVVFEVAIYRLSFEGWTKDVGERIDRRAEVRLAQYTRPITASDRVQERISAEQFERPNCWDYNEIIAWIRLVWDGPGPVIKGYMFALGSQGSYKFKERFRRGFVPHPFLDGSPNYKVLEEWFDDGESNDEI